MKKIINTVINEVKTWGKSEFRFILNTIMVIWTGIFLYNFNNVGLAGIISFFMAVCLTLSINEAIDYETYYEYDYDE